VTAAGRTHPSPRQPRGVPSPPSRPRPRSEPLSAQQDSPFSLCWKEGENSLAVILAIRASSWAFWAAVRAASALAREWEVLGETEEQ
jgi:hypothetical protein